MRVKIFILLMASVIAFGIISCGGGSDSYPELTGTWYGVWEENLSGTAFTVEITFYKSGAITKIVEDGDITGLRGSVNKESEKIYSVNLNDGSNGLILMDPSENYFTYFDTYFFVAVFQKDATTLPAYQLSDYEGTWAGYSVQVDNEASIIDSADTVLTIDNNMDVIGTTVDGAFSGSILDWLDESRGVASGDNTAGDAFFHLFLSADKMFATSYACPDTYGDFDECEFGRWFKQ